MKNSRKFFYVILLGFLLLSTKAIFGWTPIECGPTSTLWCETNHGCTISGDCCTCDWGEACCSTEVIVPPDNP